MRFGFSGIPVLLAGLISAQPAMAETVVIECTITSGDPDPVLVSQNKHTVLYKIGDGKWLEWSPSDKRWEWDRCYHLGFLQKGESGANVRCILSPSQFHADAGAEDATGRVVFALDVDRQNGSLETWAHVAARGEPVDDHRAAGTCTSAAEPVVAPVPALAPVPPPPRKF